ncbi:MAG: CcoQ/FixQ family Cbb3-type cytochrome c oxidase assembly chaperone [Calditrichaeota bacterium]|nr:MAG: CcoQ/FixQ family Cbb3-type cytochrome c oxidase assembly chaperone [Calditrichota bacterium]MBL1204977.1 CcoQ/FixQ family Cbb3-type cytochrome c oxidase assembly chaperone [Calditrichota bacterium]NOG44807.1 CcoQ/FixQ family Cbb3-type cytochrome c oxidase assembly chaperone [Calditrichota bacterium]
MIKNVLESISGVEIFPLISLLIFTTFFVVVLFWVVKLDKKTVKKLENMPLEDNDQSQNIGRK